MNINLVLLEGKTIKKISQPGCLSYRHIRENKTSYNMKYDDDNIQIEFTDGTILKLSSWDWEGYSSGIKKEIIN